MRISKQHPFLIFKANSDGGYARRRHSHKEVSLGYIEKGKTTVSVCGCDFSLAPGDWILIPAGAAHLCMPDKTLVFQFKMIYMDVEWWTTNFKTPAGGFLPAASHGSPAIANLFSKIRTQGTKVSQNDIVSILKTIERTLTLTESGQASSHKLIEKLHKTIKATPQKEKGIEEYAKDIGMSKYTLIRKYARTFGLTPHADKINMRIQLAILLFERDMTMTEIAYECGFSDQSHFIRCFKQYSGMQPGEYRRAILSNSC